MKKIRWAINNKAGKILGLIVGSIMIITTCFGCSTENKVNIDTSGVPVVRTATYIVAASNATAAEKAQADYVCDGKDDNIQIQAAIDANPTQNVKIHLSMGQFNISASIKATGSTGRVINIEGEGSGWQGTGATDSQGVTQIYVSNGANCNGFQNYDNTLRYLFLSNLVLDGNKNNNTSGNGIYCATNNFWIGAWQTIGLQNVVITNFKNSGILTTTYPSFISAVGLVCNYNGDYGAYIRGGGCTIEQPTWFYNNGKANLYLSGSDNVINAYVEGGSQYGAEFDSVCGSQITIWAGTNNWQGVFVHDNTGSRGNQYQIYSYNNCVNLSGAPYADYPGQIFIGGAVIDSTFDVSIQGSLAQPNTDGIFFSYAPANLTFNGVIQGARYGVNIINPSNASNVNFDGCDISGGTAPVLITGAYTDANYSFTDNVGYIGRGETRTIVTRVSYNSPFVMPIYNVENGYLVTDVWVNVVVPWDSKGVTMDIGDASNPGGFLPNKSIDLTTTGYYGLSSDSRGSYLWDSQNNRVLQKVYTGNDTINAAVIGSTGATQGACDVYIKITKISP